jgi:DNA polymerase-4
MRKIVHIDMDAFYASVEQWDDPQLRGQPVIVAWRGNRSVVCAASYEARKFGVRSAMPAVRAERLCPDAVFLPPDFPRYRTVSRQVRDIFHRHTDLIEPLSLDEAYLDVTENKTGLPTATQVARTIRGQIRTELQLTASAGVAPNKFLAKIASDWKKPNGLFVIQPEEVDAFLLPLPVGRLPGVGKVTEEKLKGFDVHTIADLRRFDCPFSRTTSAAMVPVSTNWRAVSTKAESYLIGRQSPSQPKIRSNTTYDLSRRST